MNRLRRDGVMVVGILLLGGCVERDTSTPEELVTGFYRAQNVSTDGACAASPDPGLDLETVLEVYDDGSFSVGLPSFGESFAAIRRPDFAPIPGGYIAADAWSNECGATIDWETFAVVYGPSVEITDLTTLTQDADCRIRDAMPDVCTIEAVYELQLEDPCLSPCEIQGGAPVQVGEEGMIEPPEPLHCACP